jgi:hypothetical protein
MSMAIADPQLRHDDLTSGSKPRVVSAAGGFRLSRSSPARCAAWSCAATFPP